MKVTVLADYLDGTQSKNTDVSLDDIDNRSMFWKLMTNKELVSITIIKHKPIKKFLTDTVHQV